MKKAIGVVAGLALFIGGTMMLVNYVRGAEQRLEAAEELVDVVVLSAPVEAGDHLGGALRSEQVPARLVNADAVRPGDVLDGLVAGVDLVDGEQLLWSRLGRPGEIEAPITTRGEIPEGYTAVTIRLDAERAFGGLLLPGMRVAVIGSFSLDLAPDLSLATVPAGAGPVGDLAELDSVDATHVMVKTASVVEVQTEQPVAGEVADDSAALSPEGDFLVTLAVPIADAERIVFAAEWGSMWLVRHGPAARLDDVNIQTTASIYRQAVEAEELTDTEATPNGESSS